MDEIRYSSGKEAEDLEDVSKEVLEYEEITIFD